MGEEGRKDEERGNGEVGGVEGFKVTKASVTGPR
jgi:hypothetical protein